MSFAAGMGAGMGAGVGAGIAIGMGAGKNRACREIREYIQSNGITIHDSSGAGVDVETMLSDAVSVRECSAGKSSAMIATAIVLLGVLVLGIVAYLHFQ